MVTHVFQKFCVAESKRHVEFEVPGTRVTAEFVRKTGVGILSKLHESIWTKLESMSQQKQHSSCPRMMPTSWIHTKSLGSSSYQRAPGHTWHDVIWRMDPWRFDQIRLSGKRKFGRQGAKTVTVLACKGLQRFQKSRSWLAIIGDSWRMIGHSLRTCLWAVQAYIARCKLHHPDLHGGRAAHRCKLLIGLAIACLFSSDSSHIAEARNHGRYLRDGVPRSSRNAITRYHKSNAA